MAAVASSGMDITVLKRFHILSAKYLNYLVDRVHISI